MTHQEACAILAEQEQASADENDAARWKLAPADKTNFRGSIAHNATLVLLSWASAKRNRLDGRIDLAMQCESEAERIIRRNGFDW